MTKNEGICDMKCDMKTVTNNKKVNDKTDFYKIQP